MTYTRQWIRSLLAALTLIVLVGCVTETEGDGPRRGTDEARLRAQLDLGRVYLGRNDLDHARGPLQKALEIDSTSWEAHDLLAALYLQQGDYKRAEQHWKSAVRYSSGARARNNYAAYLVARGRFDEACGLLKQATNDLEYPSRAQVYENLGMCELRRGDSKAAEQAFRRALSLNDRLPSSQLEFSELALQAGRLDDAWRAYQQFRQLGSQSARSLWIGIQVSRARRDQNAEASYALMLRSQFPKSAEYRSYQESTP